MRNLGIFLLSALAIVVTGACMAAGNDPFLYLATTDPSVPPGAVAKVNDIELFGGVFADRSFGNVIKFWDADYMNSYTAGGIYGRDVFDIGAGFVAGAVVGAAVRFVDDDLTSGELWAGIRIRHRGLVIGNLAISPALTVGLSAVSAPTELEHEREIHYDGDASFLGFLGPEVSFRLRQAPDWELVYQLHHRTGGNGTFGNMGEGSNANTVGLRYRF